MKKYYIFIFIIISLYFAVNQRKHFNQFNSKEKNQEYRLAKKSDEDQRKYREQQISSQFQRSNLNKFGNNCLGDLVFPTGDIYRDLKAFKIAGRVISDWTNYFYNENNENKILRLESSKDSDNNEIVRLKLFLIDKNGEFIAQSISNDETINPSQERIDKYLNGNVYKTTRIYSMVKNNIELHGQEYDSVISEIKFISPQGEYTCRVGEDVNCRCLPQKSM